jgi:ATP-binding cassette subfamily B protein
MKVLIFIRDVFRTFPWRLVGNVLLLVLESLVGALAIFTIAPVIDFFIHSDLEQASPVTRRAGALLHSLGLPVSLSSFLTLCLLSQFLKNGLAIFARHQLLRTRYAMLRNLMVGTFEDFFHARWLFFSSSKQGTLLNMFLYELTVVGNALGALVLFSASFLQLIFYLAVPFSLSWQVTSFSLAIGVVFALPLLLLGKVSYRLGRLNTSTGNAVAAVIQESLSVAKVILGFGNQQKSIRSLAQAFEAHRVVTLKSQTLTIATPFLYEPLGVVVLVVAMMTAQQFAVPLSEIAVLLWALRCCISQLGSLIVHKNTILNFFPSYEQITRLKQQARELRQPSGQRPFTGFTRELAIESVHFAYPGHEPVLADISLRIPKGTMVAFVGESGTGKSTLIDLIMGFHEPSSGRITFDGVPLPEFDIDAYRRRIGYVPQESVLFNTTIRDNLRWAKDTATDDEIHEACRQAHADEFIRRFPAGYDTVVGDRGVRLSGGQCQRVALARAILRNPELLILDEATSSLDTHSERLIQQAIEAVAKETTVIVIAHRLSTIVHADYVYVLHQGRIAESGTYQSLVSYSGHFARMAQMQLLETA